MKTMLLLPALLLAGAASQAADLSHLNGALPFVKFERKPDVVSTQAASDAKDECQRVAELEGTAEISHDPIVKDDPGVMEFSYASCKFAPRDDMEPPYEERFFRGPDHYLLVVLVKYKMSNPSVLENQSEILVYRDGEYVGMKGTFDLEKLRKEGSVRISGFVKHLGKAELKITRKKKG